MKKIIAIFLLFLSVSAQAVTLVYNLRVRRVFTVAAVLEQMRSRWVATAVPLFFTQSRRLLNELTNLKGREKRRAGGSLINVRYIPSKHWWLEATTGIETDHATFTGTDPFHASRTGFDDLVLSAGYRHFIGKKIQAVAYGIGGIPTKRELKLTDRFTPLLGTRIFSLGAGGELSYSFFSELQQSLALIAQVRFIHGFDRSYTPIAPKGSKIQPGNGTDLLLTGQYRKRRTIIETGYNATFFTNAALRLPTGTFPEDTVIRHTGYASLSHAIFRNFLNKPIILGAGFNASYAHAIDSRSFTAWIHGSIVF